MVIRGGGDGWEGRKRASTHQHLNLRHVDGAHLSLFCLDTPAMWISRGEFQSRPRVVADERAGDGNARGWVRRWNVRSRLRLGDDACVCFGSESRRGKTRSPRGEREFKKHALKRARSRVTSPRRRPSPRCTWKSANSKLRGVSGQTSASSRLWREKTKIKDEMLAQVASHLWSNYNYQLIALVFNE